MVITGLLQPGSKSCAPSYWAKQPAKLPLLKIHSPKKENCMQLHRPFFAGIAFACAFFTTQASTQTLPSTSRTVFKCEVAGKTFYSDSPCLGAKTIHVEPTRGLNKSSGREVIGSDVRHEQHREIVAEAILPLTGMNAKQLAIQARRMKLPAQSQRECQRLDAEIPAMERREKNTPPASLTEIQVQLFRMRHSFREQGC